MWFMIKSFVITNVSIVKSKKTNSHIWQISIKIVTFPVHKTEVIYGMKEIYTLTL